VPLPSPPRIGSLELSSPLLLAPLSGRTDVAFRLGVRELGGLGLAFTDLVNPRGAMARSLRTAQILATGPADRPLGVQLYGAEPEVVAEAARRVEAELGPAVIDINMGCPVWKVTRRGGGAALLADPPAAARVAAAVASAVKVPVTAKLRLGQDAGRITAPEIARMLAGVGVAALIVHGRTTEQRYSGSVDLAGIRRVVEAVPGLPVFANGNVNSHASAVRAVAETGAAGLAIGRAALRNPWIFRQILAEDRGEPRPEPSRVERVEFMRVHFRRLVDLRGVYRGCRQIRKWASAYGPLIGMDRAARERLLRIEQPAELEALADELAGGRG
jgi:nifR3 family TIM-barrel protein